VTSSALSLIVQVPIDEHGNAGKVEVYKSDIKPDDFCISQNGNLYVTTHPQNIIYVVKNRRPEIIADSNGTGVNDWWTKGNTAAVFGKGKDDAQWIYVISDGGVWSCGGNESCLKPATLTRIYVGEDGYQGENR
jgi:hypothetical protein